MLLEEPERGKKLSHVSKAVPCFYLCFTPCVCLYNPFFFLLFSTLSFMNEVYLRLICYLFMHFCHLFGRPESESP